MSRIRIFALVLVGTVFLANGALAAATGLDSALEHLQAARNALEQGARKDGHRKQALDSVNQAIEHVRKGIDEENKKQQKTERKEEKQQEKTTQQEQKQQQKQEKAAQQQQKEQEKAAQQQKKQEKKAKE